MSFLQNKKEVLPGLYVGAQLTKNDFEALNEVGIKTIICNRPDKEEENQPLFAEIAKEASKYGIKAIFLPFIMRDLNHQHVHEMQNLLKTETKPIYAYCRSGGRVVNLCRIISNMQNLNGTISS